jgi:hypothetical protein
MEKKRPNSSGEDCDEDACDDAVHVKKGHHIEDRTDAAEKAATGVVGVSVSEMELVTSIYPHVVSNAAPVAQLLSKHNEVYSTRERARARTRTCGVCARACARERVRGCMCLRDQCVHACEGECGSLTISRAAVDSHGPTLSRCS